MPTSTITWLVLARDLPPTIRVQGADRLAAAMVLDVDTGLVRGVAIDGTKDGALRQAMVTALRKPAAELPPGPPGQVLCDIGLADQVGAALTAAGSRALPEVVEVHPVPEAEDIFDSFLGHMSGRAQPADPPTPSDWELLIEQALAFRRTEPWKRWSDEQDLLVMLNPSAATSEHYVAIVMGQAGVQRGLALYPGSELATSVRSPEADPALPPAGTILLTLDPPDGVPVELVDRAVRYGWPEGDEIVPLAMAFTPDGAEEIGRADAQRLTAALAAVAAFDGRGLRPADDDKPVAGSITLADQRLAEFSVRHRPHHEPVPEATLRMHRAGTDLLPAGTPVTLGHATWHVLPDLRGAARIHRPAPLGAPAPTGRELPLLVVSPEQRHGPALAARIAELDPFGVSSVDTQDGHRALVLAGGNGAEILMHLPADHPALVAFLRRYRQTKGRHVVLVADAASATGEGTVHGMFECHQPPPPTASRPASKRSGGTNRR